MKLSHNLRPDPKVQKGLGLHSKGLSELQCEQSYNSNLLKNTGRCDQYGSYQTSSSSSKVCPYDDTLVYSQANDRISQFKNILSVDPPKYKSTDSNKSSRQYHSHKKQSHPLKLPAASQQQGEMYAKIKSEILEEVYALILEHREQSAKSLRQAVFKIDSSIKRECLTQLNRQFLSMSFLEESEKRFAEIEEQMRSYNKIFEFQDLLTKQKQSYKISQECLNKMNQQVQRIRSQLNAVQFSVCMNQESNRKVQNMFEQNSTHAIQFQQQVRKIKQTLISVQNCQQNVVKRVSQLQNMVKQVKYTQSAFSKNEPCGQQHNQDGHEQKLTQKEVKKINSKVSLQNEKLFQVLQIAQHQFKSGRSLSYSLESIETTNPKILKPPSSVSSLKDIKSMKYLLDADNNLMDENGYYILDLKGNQITLTEDQILFLKESKVVKYQQQ